MQQHTHTRIAMWSGPRNISTALMRSFGNRTDTFVCDEPLYAHYLRETGTPHPGYVEIIAAHETNWRRATRRLTGPIPRARAIFYQKHMAHHLLPHIERDWLLQLRHAFLVRHPAEMLRSLSRVIPKPSMEDTGLPQQVALLDWIANTLGTCPPVIDARDVLTDPQAVLSQFCKAVDIPWDPDMLAWESGPRATDGVWGPYWYDSVYGSTGFRAPAPAVTDVPDSLRPVLETCMPLYDQLRNHRTQP